jgi:hypothetical protein
VLRRVRPAALIVSGDLTDSKTARQRMKSAGIRVALTSLPFAQAHRLGSMQYASEWASYRRVASALVAAAGLGRDERLLLEVRGNHDAFDVYRRGGRGDLYAHHAAAGRRNATALAAVTRVGGAASGAGGPSVAIVSFDAARSPGARRPANFAGVASPALRRELRTALRSARSADATLAFGHFPLSFLEGPRRDARASVAAALAAHNASAYLCGHLHWRFGDRLHAWHGRPLPAPLLELEAGDWKEARAWRLLAFDADAKAALSFRDFVFDAAKKAPFTVMLTSPGDARYAQPPKAAPDAHAPRARVKALVFPPRGVDAKDMRVVAAAVCGAEEMATVPLQPLGGGGPVWAGPAIAGRFSGSPLPLEALERRCEAPGGLRVRVTVTLIATGAVAAADERPVLLRPAAGPAPMGTTRVATVMMTWDGPRLGAFLMRLTAAVHGALFLIAPPLAAAWARRRDAAGRDARPPHVLLLPLLLMLEPLRLLRASLVALGRRPRLLAAHGAYCAYLAVGPWAAADLFSDPEAPKPGLLFALGMSTPGLYMPGMDAGFVTGPSLLLISAWTALVGAALAAADDAGSGAAEKGWSARRGVAAMLSSRPRGAALAAATAAMLCASGAVSYELRESYGDVAVAASPGVAWVPFIAAAALRAGLAAPPPQRSSAQPPAAAAAAKKQE